MIVLACMPLASCTTGPGSPPAGAEREYQEMINEPFFKVLPSEAVLINRSYSKPHWQGGEFGGPSGHWIEPGFDVKFTSHLTYDRVIQFYTQAARRYGFRLDLPNPGNPSWSKTFEPPCMYGPPCQLFAGVDASYNGPTPVGIPVVAASYDFSGGP